MADVQSPQSSNHIMLLEPVDFYANPETMTTNSYQHEQGTKDKSEIQREAQKEFRAMRDLLIEHGVTVTTVLGQEGCPDDIFINWVSTHDGGRMILYPMLNENRQKERRKDIIDILRRTYKDVQDFTLHEQHEKALEATGAMCLDRVHKVAYQVRSSRAHDDIAAMWCKMNGYTHIPFDTEYKGKPVYHADVVMWIGTDLVGICSECLIKDDIVKHTKHRREVIEFTTEQMEAFCGNSLEVVGTGGEKMLLMSAGGYKTLRDDQKNLLAKHYKTIIKPEIPTIEYYGGGSARCMVLELF